MIKYIKVEWPDIQKFQELPNYYEKCYEHESGMITFVPENLYNKVINKPQFPNKYENTNLGTIVCYETRAVVNGCETFWYDLSDLKEGNKVLIYNYDIASGYNRPKWIITTCKVCDEKFPIILEDAACAPGINCEIVGHYNPEILF